MQDGLDGIEEAGAIPIFDQQAAWSDIQIVALLHQAGIQDEDALFLPVAEGIVLNYFKRKARRLFQPFIQEAYGAEEAGVDEIHENRGSPVDREHPFGLLQERGFRDNRNQFLLRLFSGAGKKQQSS